MSGAMVATAPVNFEKSVVAPIDFDEKSDGILVKLGVTKRPCTHRLNFLKRAFKMRGETRRQKRERLNDKFSFISPEPR